MGVQRDVGGNPADYNIKCNTWMKRKQSHGDCGKMRLRATLYGGQHAIVYSFYTNRTRKSTDTFGARIKLSKDSRAVGPQRFQHLSGNETQWKKGREPQCLVGNFTILGET